MWASAACRVVGRAECILVQCWGVISEPGWLRGRRVMYASGFITFSPVPNVVEITIELVSGNRLQLHRITGGTLITWQMKWGGEVRSNWCVAGLLYMQYDCFQKQQENNQKITAHLRLGADALHLY
jgi:predicted hydrolase (HD superfamily)